MPIHYAAINNHTQVIKTLLSHDPSIINAKDCENETPLHYAAGQDHYETVELLLSQPDVDGNVRCAEGKTADDMTTSVKIKRMIELNRLSKNNGLSQLVVLNSST